MVAAGRGADNTPRGGLSLPCKVGGLELIWPEGQSPELRFPEKDLEGPSIEARTWA